MGDILFGKQGMLDVFVQQLDEVLVKEFKHDLSIHHSPSNDYHFR